MATACVKAVVLHYIIQHSALTGTVAPTTFDPVPAGDDLHPLTKLCHGESIMFEFR